MTVLDTTPEQMQTLASLPADEPVVMINLLNFRQDGGAERYMQYGREVAPHLERVGAQIVYAGNLPKFVIGEGTHPWWDAILVVQYPTPTAFVQMVTSEQYAKVHEHRAAALDSAELVATSIWTMQDDILSGV